MLPVIAAKKSTCFRLWNWKNSWNPIYVILLALLYTSFTQYAVILLVHETSDDDKNSRAWRSNKQWETLSWERLISQVNINSIKCNHLSNTLWLLNKSKVFDDQKNLMHYLKVEQCYSDLANNLTYFSNATLKIVVQVSPTCSIVASLKKQFI